MMTKQLLWSAACACAITASAEPRSVPSPNAAPTPRSIKQEAGSVNLSWPSQTGHGYIVERKQALSDTWSTYSVETAGGLNTVSVTLTNPGFYQVSEAAIFAPGQSVPWAVAFPELDSTTLSQATAVWNFDDGTRVTNKPPTITAARYYTVPGVKTATVNVSHPSGWNVSRLWAVSILGDSSTNLLANGGFEVGSNSLPFGWVKDQWGNNTAQFVYPVPGYGGSGSAAQVIVSNWRSGDAKFYQEIPAVPNAKYHYSDWYQASALNDLTVQYQITNGTSSSYVYQWITSPPPASVWQFLEATFTSPTNARTIAVLHNMPTNGWLTIDNAELDLGGYVVPTNDVANLVYNPGFEIASGSTPTGWLKGGYGSNTRSYIYPVAGHSSPSAAEIVVSNYASGDAKWYFTDVPATPNQLYSWSDWYTASVESDVTVQFTTNGPAGQGYIYKELGRFAPASTWQQTQGTFMAPANAVSFTIFHSILTNGSLTMDDVKVTTLKSSGTNHGLVSISFDDNWETTVTNVPPILAAAGYRATFYVITDTVGWQDYATLDELKALQAGGHEIGSHTVQHLDLVLVNQTNAALARAELVNSRQTLINWGFQPNSFAYPFGSYNTAVENLVQQAGYTSATTTDDGYNQLVIPDPYKITRGDITSDISLATIQARIDAALANDVWLILLFHHIDDTQTQYSYPVQGFQAVVDYLKARNATVVTVSEGLQLLAP